MLKRSIFTLIIVLLSVVLVSADGVDDAGIPNDPEVNDRANACFEGGNMDGKCDTEWEWMCGWHIIRLGDAQDEEVRAAFPQGCVSLLPPLIQPLVQEVVPVAVVVSYPGGGCETYYGEYRDFAGGNFLAAGGPVYKDAACTTFSYNAGWNIVYALNPTSALALCEQNIPGSTASHHADNTYRCL